MINSRFQPIGKRMLDLALVTLALIFVIPLLGLLAMLVWFKLGTPIFFRQQRPGQYGQPFTIYKFRTLTNTRDAEGRLLPDAERLTRFGDFLRRTSLDELPELFNVLKGEMSLVGPRPLLMIYLNRYSPEQMRRHEVKPGLTGWAQINGRNALSWEQKLKLDIWYVNHWSLGLDLRILLLTFWKVFKREGINHPGHVTMAEFRGNSANGAGLQLSFSQPAGLVEPANFSPELKAQVVLEVISGVKSILETCREYGLNPQLLAKWQADFLENAARAFQSEGHPNP